MQSVPRGRKFKVFVHLGHGFGATKWRERYAAGLIPGLNQELPYGYHLAPNGGNWSITYSEDAKEAVATQLLRRGLLRLIGFDLIHAWRNRHHLFASDVVWTHTEREHLAVLLLRWLSRGDHRPAIIAQCIWLFDKWPNLPLWKQQFYLCLLRQAELVTTLSPRNLEYARVLLPQTDCEAMMFGVGSAVSGRVAKTTSDGPIKLLALGNDYHRDWEILIEAFGGISDYQVRIGSNSAPRRLVNRLRNVSIQPANNAQELRDLYEWSDLVVVPLKENLHASGITVVLEAILLGVPVVCTDTGGIRAYFSDDHIRYVPVSDPNALRAAADELATSITLRRQLVLAAQKRVVSAGFTAQGFADRHRRLSESLLKIHTKSFASGHDSRSDGLSPTLTASECTSN